MRAFANIQLQVRPGGPGAVMPRILKAFSLESLRIPAPSYPAIAARLQMLVCSEGRQPRHMLATVQVSSGR